MASVKTGGVPHLLGLLADVYHLFQPPVMTSAALYLQIATPNKC